MTVFKIKHGHLNIAGTQLSKRFILTCKSPDWCLLEYFLPLILLYYHYWLPVTSTMDSFPLYLIQPSTASGTPRGWVWFFPTSVFLHVPFSLDCSSWRHSYHLFLQPLRVSGSKHLIHMYFVWAPARIPHRNHHHSRNLRGERHRRESYISTRCRQTSHLKDNPAAVRCSIVWRYAHRSKCELVFNCVKSWPERMVLLCCIAHWWNGFSSSHVCTFRTANCLQQQQCDEAIHQLYIHYITSTCIPTSEAVKTLLKGRMHRNTTTLWTAASNSHGGVSEDCLAFLDCTVHIKRTKLSTLNYTANPHTQIDIYSLILTTHWSTGWKLSLHHRAKNKPTSTEGQKKEHKHKGSTSILQLP